LLYLFILFYFHISHLGTYHGHGSMWTVKSEKKVCCNINHILISHSKKTQILYAVLETDVLIF